jgi:hypothetical protein
MCKVVTINPEGHLKNKLLSLAKALITWREIVKEKNEKTARNRDKEISFNKHLLHCRHLPDILQGLSLIESSQWFTKQLPLLCYKEEVTYPGSHS